MGGMPRRPRMELEPGVHHVFARGNGRQLIFFDDEDRQRYLQRLAGCIRLMRWSCLAYCLMGNHLHLLVETVEPNLWRGMHRLQGGYAQGFNHRHKCSGCLFGERYGAVRVDGERQFLAALGYIAMNPPAAGLCEEPADWEWSSHGAI